MQAPMENFAAKDQQREKEETLSKTLVSNDCVDFRGRIADKRTTGGWKASPFIIANEVAERLAFFAIAVNMVEYLVLEMRQSLPVAATHVTDWIGAAYVLTIFGAFLADAYLGRFKTIIVFCSIYALGMVLLTISASIDSLRPPPCKAVPCEKATDGQNVFLFFALALIALGTGGIKPSTLGCNSRGVYKRRDGMDLGLWGAYCDHDCFSHYFSSWYTLLSFPKAYGSPFTRFLQVMVASARNHLRGVKLGREVQLYEVNTEESDIKGARKLPHTSQFMFLDKAAVATDPEANTKNRWKLCTVTQVEEFKSLIRVLPIWASTITLSISFAQLATFFISQASIMDRKLSSNFTIPVGSVNVFSAINAVILVPIHEKLIVPILSKHTGHRHGITSLQRLQFFYDEATDGTRSISSALFLSEIGIGSWLSTAIVKIVERTTGGEENGWLRNDLNKSRLDYFYWILTALNGFNFLVFLLVAWCYESRNSATVSTRYDNGSVKWEDDKWKFKAQPSN
ncbi:hypothetical protein GH714_015826 [Hevea brasiliensis]|uniref:Major facilitator superfamily (MFS) profile domain-containing protein n=1 Tax=Hevea brasiliensis TaxID=3981 RepID=A0A6A6NHK5_HEVBR|nr:hypothetical protein GH714_015826 [Hevea brasiliensis]